ncbi:hypothetical protein NHX12_002228 [Muraenolepis orangiensis]|uniref:Uncharacterized protein n=1 Tax=Muraenolepis orangiensis TaxID=630683 RepID=A0A9Q0DWN1_9TELE|nr:hypothetical protein NHX12_002228 [Muraenolepis orangiensis]
MPGRRRLLPLVMMKPPCSLYCCLWFLLLLGAGSMLILLHLPDLSMMVQQQTPGDATHPPTLSPSFIPPPRVVGVKKQAGRPLESPPMERSGQGAIPIGENRGSSQNSSTLSPFPSSSHRLPPP